MAWIATIIMGIVLGMLGGGGGILTVPILSGLFGFSAVEATGASLFIVGCTSLAGSLPALKNKEIDLEKILILTASALAGSFAARKFLVPAIPDPLFGFSKGQVLMTAFALLMIVVGVKMLLPSPSVEGEVEPQMAKFDPRLVLIGLSIGLLSGTLGAGGGFLILPTLTLLMGIEMKRAVSSSLFVIAIQSLAGFAGELGRPIQWTVLLPVLAVSLAGMWLGVMLRPRINSQALKKIFAAMVLIVALYQGSQVLMNRF